MIWKNYDKILLFKETLSLKNSNCQIKYIKIYTNQFKTKNPISENLKCISLVVKCAECIWCEYRREVHARISQHLKPNFKWLRPIKMVFCLDLFMMLLKYLALNCNQVVPHNKKNKYYIILPLSSMIQVFMECWCCCFIWLVHVAQSRKVNNGPPSYKK